MVGGCGEVDNGFIEGGKYGHLTIVLIKGRAILKGRVTLSRNVERKLVWPVYML